MYGLGFTNLGRVVLWAGLVDKPMIEARREVEPGLAMSKEWPSMVVISYVVYIL